MKNVKFPILLKKNTLMYFKIHGQCVGHHSDFFKNLSIYKRPEMKSLKIKHKMKKFKY